MSTKSAAFLVQMVDVPNAQRAKHLPGHMKAMMKIIEAGDVGT